MKLVQLRIHSNLVIVIIHLVNISIGVNFNCMAKRSCMVQAQLHGTGAVTWRMRSCKAHVPFNDRVGNSCFPKYFFPSNFNILFYVPFVPKVRKYIKNYNFLQQASFVSLTCYLFVSGSMCN